MDMNPGTLGTTVAPPSTRTRYELTRLGFESVLDLKKSARRRNLVRSRTSCFFEAEFPIPDVLCRRPSGRLNLSFSKHSRSRDRNILASSGPQVPRRQMCVHLAALGGHVEVLRHLVWFGANINARHVVPGKLVVRESPSSCVAVFLSFPII
uniref:Ankyrin repeat protein n=1 Tax=Timema tahoe TaxID=61484 RepID=A0A7R9ICR6_9NEOP|nr:unnamed protein product [Timema tahoe]